jgi:hypothetical protein
MPIHATGRDLLTRSFLGWSALERAGLVCVILVGLWLMVAWAVALP